MVNENRELFSQKFVYLLHELAKFCANQIEVIESGDLESLQAINREKDQVMQRMSQMLGEYHTELGGCKVDVQQALDTYMAMEAGVQKALSTRSGEVADQLMDHYKARLGHDGYEEVAKLFTPIARLFPDSSRYIDERR